MFVECGSARLAADVHGTPGDRADVLLLHAGVSDRRSWGPLIRAIERDGSPHRRIAAFDARGFGETTFEPEPYAVQDDALAVLDTVGIERAVLVASSFGGFAAVDLAVEHPERVAGLVLIAPAVEGAPPHGFDEPPELAALVEDLKRAEAKEDLAEVNRIEARIWLDGAAAPEGRVGGEARRLFLDMNAGALAAVDPGDPSREVDAWSRLGEIDCPALLVVGTLDVPGFLDRCRQLAALLADSRLVEISGVAHLPHLEGDPTCLSAVTTFLDDVPAG